MATYKVLQDIEAEDKLLGPLTLKQFIFAIITIMLGFLCYVFYQINFLLAIPWLLPISFFGFMATPISRDQPNDVWLASRIRFMIKPKKRVWDQFGMQELVTVTAPKRIEIHRTDGLNQTEVRSRLSALSSMMDTRGWAIKNDESYRPGVSSVIAPQNDSGRLLDIMNNQDNGESLWVKPSEDILDTANNTIAQRIDTTIKQKQSEKIEMLKTKMREGGLTPPVAEQKSASKKEEYSFILEDKPHLDPGYAGFGSQVINPGSRTDATIKTKPAAASSEEKKLLEKIHKNKEIEEHIKTSSREHRIEPHKEKKETATTSEKQNAIIKQLSQANDISVASIASLAKSTEEKALSNNDVISLH